VSRTHRLAAIATRSADKVGIVRRACTRCAGFYRSIRTFAVFGRGWLARNAPMEAIGVRMALTAQPVVFAIMMLLIIIGLLHRIQSERRY
jgi:lysozyme family protein